MSELLFDLSVPGRRGIQYTVDLAVCDGLPQEMRRSTLPHLPAVSELDVVRHYTRLSELNYSIDTNFYPLGSCTMKYNPRIAHAIASESAYATHHPLVSASASQGWLSVLYELQETLQAVTGMTAVALSPMAGAQGEWAGVMMIRAYHASRHDTARTEMLVPEAAHGTNPASAAAAGFIVREVPSTDEGDVDLEALAQLVGPKTAGIMLTNPSTFGVFERNIEKLAAIVHEAGGLLYYDGANLNAILGRVRPGDMGFDVMHLNLHKTFATPHGGGGPGAGPVAVNAKLAPFLPIPRVMRDQTGYRWLTEQDCPQTIGRLSAFGGNAGVLLRAFVYARMLGHPGMRRVGLYATLNAQYLAAALRQIGYTLAFPMRRATHEFIVTLKPITDATGVTALDVAKRLLDYGFYAPTIYFPLVVPECLLIEPTETESPRTLDCFIEAMRAIWHEIQTNVALLKAAPHTCAVQRLDEVRAARALDLSASFRA